MTTQETTDSLVQRFRAALGDRETAAREWERQAQQMSASLIAERAAHEANKVRVAKLERALRRLIRAVENAGSHFGGDLPDAMAAARALEDTTP